LDGARRELGLDEVERIVIEYISFWRPMARSVQIGRRLAMVGRPADVNA